MNVKKFGTFSGVFTPSILTILGVIMFLRLPTLVGQGGLWLMLAVIGVAHIISITTGLSVASIATDKRVRAGGSYYIISRSLGLPIGGTLGIALFVGMSFSISLYLIGFAESLLVTIGMEASPDNIRVAGTLALAGAATLTLVSTSLTLRTQYFIMTAIGLAVASVLWGARGAAPAAPHMLPAAGVTFAALFGIFFPAVTGFEAGVSMSGDLKNPKKSIPVGTLSAIVVGLLVYVGLAVFFAYRVDAKLLRDDPGVLSTLSFYAPLLMAGVWGATISSALGSLLGAPRILQAASLDRITPAVFGRGYGPAKEPRAALLLAILIAWGGILIGELDVIARIVSMFFITAYFFLNLSAAFESWVSPDFKPEFRVPPFVGIAGAVTCLLVMIQLDLLAMIVAFALLGLIWAYLKRKELVLDTGDTWEGVYSSIVRRALFRLSRTRLHPRNWRPNMILFSGGEEARPHLVELARSLTDRRGVVSSFELVQSDSPRIRPRTEQAIPGEEDEFDGIFSRRVECADVYRAMDEIPRYYGFSGLEPNTVLLGRAHGLKDAPRFAGLLRTYRLLDYSVMLLDYNRQRKFGDHARLDIWWSGRGNMLDFALSAARFLVTSPRWNRARTRVLVITDLAPRVELIHRHIAAILDEYRVTAEVRVIFNGIEQKPYFDIIARESGPADLTMLGMPPMDPDFAADDVGRMNHLAERMGSLLWLRASDFFREIYTGSETETVAPDPGRVEEDGETPDFSPYPELAGALERMYSRGDEIQTRFEDELGVLCFDGKEDLVRALDEAARAALARLERTGGEEYHRRRAVLAAHNDFHFQFQRAFSKFRARKDGFRDTGELPRALRAWFADRAAGVEDLPRLVRFARERSCLDPQSGDGLRLRLYKWGRRLFARGPADAPVPDRAPLRRHARALLTAGVPDEVESLLRELNQNEYRFTVELLQNVAGFHAALQSFEATGRQDPESLLLFERLGESVRGRKRSLLRSMRAGMTLGLRRLARGLIDLRARRAVRRTAPGRIANLFERRLVASYQTFDANMGYFLETAGAGVLLGLFRYRLLSVARKKLDDLEVEFHGTVVRPLENLIHRRDDAKAAGPIAWRHPLPDWAAGSFEDGSLLSEFIGELQPALSALPAEVNLLSVASIRVHEEGGFDAVEPIAIALRQYVEHSLEKDFIDQARTRLEELEQQVRTVSAEAVARISLREQAAAQSARGEPGLESAPETALETMTGEIDALKEQGRTVILELGRELERYVEDLRPFALIRRSNQLSDFVREAEQARWLEEVGVVLRGLNAAAQRTLAALVFGRAGSRRLAGVFRPTMPGAQNRLDVLLEAVAGRSPDPVRLSRIPLYYLHLFTGNLGLNPDFWVGRQREVEQAERAFAHFRRGAAGALFVTGASGSGKSWFSAHVARRAFDSVFEIFAPARGVPDRSDFAELCARNFKRPGEPEEMLLHLPPSAILIHDLELFYERRPGGLAVLDEILRLVDRFGDRHCFIFNVNSRAFDLLQSLRRLDDFALGRVECGPFAPDELQRMILMRHDFTGYDFELDGVRSAELSQYRLAGFFHDMLRMTGGLPGPALRAWIRAVEPAGERRMNLRISGTARPDFLSLLSPERVLLLEQFLLHKNFTDVRLASVFGAHAPAFERHLAPLLRGGLLVRTERGVYKINPWVRHLIAQDFDRRGPGAGA